MIAELRAGEGYMKYKSVYALNHEKRDLSNWIDEELKKLDRVNDLAKAVFDGKADVLAKADSPDLRIATADLAELRAEYGKTLGEDSLRDFFPMWRFAKIMRQYASRTEAIKEDERRSRRLNEAWTSMPPYGPWSTVN